MKNWNVKNIVPKDRIVFTNEREMDRRGVGRKIRVVKVKALYIYNGIKPMFWLDSPSRINP